MARGGYRWITVGLCGALVSTACLAPAPGEAGPTLPKTVETSGLELITPAVQQSINRGLEYLAANQNDDGSLGSGSTYRRHVAVTALAGIAFLSAGNTPNRGKYGRHVEKAVQYILACTDSTGLISAPAHRQHNPIDG